MQRNLVILNRVLIDNIIFLILLLSLTIDSVNGVFVRMGALSIGQPIRIILFFFIIFRVLSLSWKLFGVLLFVYCLLMFSSFIHFYNYYNLSWFVIDIATIHKFVLMMAVWFYIHLVIKYQLVSISFFKWFYGFNLIVLIVNLVLGVFGIGYAQYSGGIGSVGFFYAGNEVSGVMICLFMPILFYVYYKKSGMTYFFVALLVLLLALIKVTKVAIIGTLFLVGIVPILHVIRHNKWNSVKSFWFFLLSLGSLFLFLFLIYTVSDQLGLISRIEYLFYEVNRGDFVTTILSERNSFFSAAKRAFVYDYSIIEQLFGSGIEGIRFSTMKYIGKPAIVEIDPMDFLFGFGFLGLSILIITFIALLVNSYQAWKVEKSEFAKLVFITNILLIVIASTSGHIFNSAMAGVFLGMFNGLVSYKGNLLNRK